MYVANAPINVQNTPLPPPGHKWGFAQFVVQIHTPGAFLQCPSLDRTNMGQCGGLYIFCILCFNCSWEKEGLSSNNYYYILNINIATYLQLQNPY